MAAPIQIDRIINKLSLIDNPKIKANCGRAYKNFNSDLNEAIEEGAVASLIAMSLEVRNIFLFPIMFTLTLCCICYLLQGKLKNQSSDEFTHPDVKPQKEKGIPAPACLIEISANPTEAQWFEKVKVTNGGAAGKGPDPPEPPAMTIDGSSEYPNMAEELDAGEIEGKTKMAFAKMQVPQNVKESHLLSDTDFMLNADRDRDDNTVDENSLTTENQDSMTDQEAQEAIAAQLAAQQGGSFASGGSGTGTHSRTGTPGGSRTERSQSFKQTRASRANSMANSRQSSAKLLLDPNSTSNTPRLASLSTQDGNSSPEMQQQTAKREKPVAKRAHGNQGTAVSSSSNAVQLKPVAHGKDVSMAEQAARLGLFT